MYQRLLPWHICALLCTNAIPDHSTAQRVQLFMNAAERTHLFTLRDGWQMNFSRHRRFGVGDASGVTIRMCCHRNQVDTNTLNSYPGEERKTRQLCAIGAYIHCQYFLKLVRFQCNIRTAEVWKWSISQETWGVSNLLLMVQIFFSRELR
jgi:hypothetical protein